MKVVFDSTIWIDHLRGIAAAKEELTRHSNASISITSWIEVMAGAQSTAEERLMQRFLADFECISLDPEIAELAAVVRRKQKLKLPDAVTFATAQMNKATLITSNTRDFSAGMAGVRIPYRV